MDWVNMLGSECGEIKSGAEIFDAALSDFAFGLGGDALATAVSVA